MPDSRSKPLAGCRVAIVAADGFELVELTEPRRAIQEAGADIQIVSLRGGAIRAWNRSDWGETLHVDLTIDQAHPDNFDALMLPGGVMNPDKLRMDDRIVEFVQAFVDDDKPIAAICHAPWLLIECGDPRSEYLRGRRITSYASLRTDLINAGADWIDEPVVIDGNLLTSRNPSDLPMFCSAMLEHFRHHLLLRSEQRA